MNDMSYSKFINGLHKSNIEINRKTLAHLAWHDAPAFARLVEIAKNV
jgi:large subunit ribosomal protein L20